MRETLERERRLVRRIGWIAVVAWALTLTLPAAAVLSVVGQSAMIEAGDPRLFFDMLIPVAMLGSIGVLALIVAVVTTVAWLFRSRTSSLEAIAARVSELEERLAAG